MISLPKRTLTKINKLSTELGISNGDFCELVIERWLSMEKLHEEFRNLLEEFSNVQENMKKDIQNLGKRLKSSQRLMNRFLKEKNSITKLGKERRILETNDSINNE